MREHGVTLASSVAHGNLVSRSRKCANFLKLAVHGERPCEEVDELVARHLETTERKIETLRRLRRELRDTLASCRGGRIAECRVIKAFSPAAASLKKKA
jgi:MerR, DNA binding